MIPEGWDSQKLEEVCINIVDCHHSTPAWTNDGFIVLRTQNIRDGVIDFSSVSFTDELHYYERIKRAVPEEGDIVVTREAPAGEVALIPAEMKVCLGQRLVLVKVNHKLVSSLYIKFYLMSSLVQRNVFQLQSNGSTVGNIRIPVLKSINLLLPPLAEQRKIADIISSWDKAIALLEQLITAKRKLKQGLMQQLLTGKKRFKQFEGSEWNQKKLGEVVEKIVGGGTPSRDNPEFWGGEIPWATVKDFTTFTPYKTQEFITKEGLLNSSSNLIPKGTVIISTRMALGKSVIYKVDVSINQDLKAIFPKQDIDNIYLYYWIQNQAEHIEKISSGSTVKGIVLTDLKKIIFLKPSLPEQQKIASILSAADAEISNLEKQLAAYKQQKRGLMQQLLQGKRI